MLDSEKAQLIRKGNQAFNEGNVDLASKIFKTTEYKDGLIRVGDYYYFDKRQPLMAYGYYKRANHSIMLEKISDGFIFALKHWLSEDKKTEEKPQG
jgi:hypothetical protein